MSPDKVTCNTNQWISGVNKHQHVLIETLINTWHFSMNHLNVYTTYSVIYCKSYYYTLISMFCRLSIVRTGSCLKYYVICALKAHIDNVFLMSIHEKGNEYNDISWNKQRVFILFRIYSSPLSNINSSNHFGHSRQICQILKTHQ